jgi:hypothetical protein
VNHQPTPKERGSGATWRLEPKAKPEGAESGETRNRTGRRSWKCEAEGQPEASAPEAPKDARLGVTRGSVAGKAGRCSCRGNPGAHRQAQLEERGCEATCSLRTGCAEGCEIRGNSKIHRRQGRKMKKPGQPGGFIGRRDEWTEAEGQPGASPLGVLKDAKFEATRRSIAGRA